MKITVILVFSTFRPKIKLNSQSRTMIETNKYIINSTKNQTQSFHAKWHKYSHLESTRKKWKKSLTCIVHYTLFFRFNTFPIHSPVVRTDRN